MHSGPLFAAIDLGSNSFHLLLARGHAQGAEIVFRTREKVRLADGLNADNVVDEDAIRRGEQCLEQFATYLHGIAAEHCIAVATAALRKATNQHHIVQRFERVLGVPIEVISGEREAELIYHGATSEPKSDEPTLVIDIGGASTEIVVGAATHGQQQPHTLRSLDMGCVVFQKRFFPGGSITKDRIDQAIATAKELIEPHQSAYMEQTWKRVMGASGTFKALCELLSNRHKSDHFTISAADLERTLARCIRAGHVDKLTFRGLREDRRAVFMGGICILQGIFQSLALTHCEIANGALREGLLSKLQLNQKPRD